MTYLTFTLRETPSQRLDLRALTPDKLSGKNHSEISAIPLWLGNKQTSVADLFDIQGNDATQLIFEKSVNRLDGIGAEMTQGSITIKGDAGTYLGQDMRGGNILLQGNAAEFAASGMRDGHIRIEGNAGDFLAAAIPGERKGMRGGTVSVMGNVGDRVGDHLRRGVILIEGSAGSYCGSRMTAGTIVVLGKTGDNLGFGMKRGTILLSKNPKTLLPTFNDAGHHDLGFLVLLLSSLKELNPHYALDPARKRVHRYQGDVACGGKGEVLVWFDDTDMNCA